MDVEGTTAFGGGRDEFSCANETIIAPVGMWVPQYVVPFGWV
jgi:hypothetical protein